MKKIYLFFTSLLFLTSNGFTQGTNCISADPFCTGNTYTFPNNTGTTAETGPDYGCLLTQPNPAWYYMQVGSSGNISITISQTDNFGNPIDVDFICWGPFANAQSPCTSLLTSANEVDCSYSTAATEVCNIPSAIAGQYYLLLITNYSNVAGTITFSQTGGTGNTNCAIVCPTAGFDGYDASNNPITFPFTTTCDDNQSYTFYAWDSATAGGYITPYYFINVNPTNSYTTNEMHFYEGGSYIGGFYPGSPAGSVPANTNFTGYISYVSPSNGNIQIELCDPYVGSPDMTYVVVDGASGNTLAGPGTWVTSDAGTGGPGGSSCQTITFPASSVTGTATFTCPTCPAGSFVTTDWGAAAFNPAAAGPGTYNITYTWDDGQGCITSATETITVTNPYDATFNYSSTSYCQNAADPTPTVTQSGGTFSSTPAGLAINTTTGTIDVSASTPGTYTVQYDRGYGTSSVCGDTQTQTITIVAPPDAGTNGSVTLCSNSSSINLFSYLGGSPDAGGSWTDPNGNAHSGTLNPATDISGNYTYTVAGTAPCANATATVSVTINPQPNAGTNGSGTYCSSDPSVSLISLLGGTPDAGGSWTDPSGNAHSGTLNPATDPSGTYTYTVTGTAPCTNASATVSITINPAPNAGTNGSVTLCSNSSSVNLFSYLGGSPDAGGSWTDPNGNAHSGTLNPATDISGNYTYTVAGTAPCANATATVSVTINPQPNAGTNGSGTYCSSDPSVSLISLLGGTPDAGGSWTDPSGNTHSGTLNPATDPSGTYTYTVTGTAPCTNASATVSITINQAPTVSISGTTTICQGETSTLTATLGGTASSVTWSSAGDGSFSSTTSLTTVYTPGTNDIASGNVVITVTTDDPAGPCTATSSNVTLTINPLPVANAGADDTLTCAATNITLDGSGSSSGANYSYNWTTPNGNIVSGGTTVNPVVNQVGSYIITVTDNTTGCSSTDTVEVFQDANIPVANAGADDTLTCSITSITLDGTGSDSGPGITYSWSTSNGNIVSGGTTTTPTVNDDGTYTITVTNTANGCSATDVVTVVFDTVSPVVNAGPDLTVNCNNSTVTADGTGSSQGTNYTYSWSTTGGNIVSGSTSLTPVFDASGTYTLTVTNNNNGCSATDNMIVTVDTIKPLANAGANDTLKCSTPVITLDGTASSTGTNYVYQWTTANGNILSGDTTLTPDVNQTGVYILTVTDTVNGCLTTDTVEVFQDASLPIADAGLDTVLTCNISTIVLDGSGSSQGANYTYSWTTSNGNIVSGANTLTPTIDSTGTYTLTVTNTANGCSATDVVTVTVDTVKPVADAGNPMVINCTNSSVTLDGSASSANAVYSWTTSTGNIVSGGTTLTPVADAAGTYVLTVTNPVNGCSAIDSVTVTIDTIKPLANAGADTIITCTNDTITLMASGSSGSNYVYQWAGTGNIVSGGSTLNPVIVSGGTYILTVTDTSNGCSTTDTVIVSEDLVAIVSINANPTSGLVPLDVDLTASGSNGTVSWDLGDGTTSSDTSLIHTYNDLGEYVVVLTVTTAGGCTASDSITIEVFGNSTLIFPNVFTPNGDGENDIFYFKAENMESLECTIFNRWGELMYSWSNPKGYWDGRTTAGKEAPSGTYFFIMKAKGLDGKEYDQKGSFTLIR